EMFRQIGDALTEERDLHFRGSRVALMGGVTADDFGFAVLAQHDWCSFTNGPDSQDGMPCTGPPLPVFSDGSVFYLSTTTGCKSPPGRRSATASSAPAGSSSRTRSASDPGSRIGLPWNTRRAPSSVNVIAGI